MKCKDCALCNDCRRVAYLNEVPFDVEHSCCRHFAAIVPKCEYACDRNLQVVETMLADTRNNILEVFR